MLCNTALCRRPSILLALPPSQPNQGHIRDAHGGGANPLLLGADAPAWVYSTAPLATPDGKPVAGPTPGSAGHAMFLSDQQVCRLVMRSPRQLLRQGSSTAACCSVMPSR